MFIVPPFIISKLIIPLQSVFLNNFLSEIPIKMFFISIISSSYLIITISGLNASINPCSFPKEEYGITFNLEIYLLDSSSSV